MIFDFSKARQKHREELLKDNRKWNNDMLLLFLILGSIDEGNIYDIADKSNKEEILDVRLVVNGVEVNLNDGLSRIVGILNGGGIINEKLQRN